MKNCQTAVVVLHYCGYDDTTACLQSLRSAMPEGGCVFVLENGSGDDSARRLREGFPWATVIDTGANLGFAGGNNVGLRAALADGVEHVCLLNNDTLVNAGFLEPLLAVFAEHPDAGMVTGPVLYAAPPNRIWSAGGRMGWWTALTRHCLVGQPRSALPRVVQETEYANGCFVMISRACLEKVGLMDERYFLYYEDTDWCARVRKAGFKIYYTPGPAVLHKVSAGTKGMRPLLRYYCDRNSLYFARKNLPCYALPVYGSVFLTRIAYRLAVAVCRRDYAGTVFAWRALRDGVTGRMGPYRET